MRRRSARIAGYCRNLRHRLDHGRRVGANASEPATVVAQFYEALRKGDDTAIARLLTDKAREETSKSGLGIQSQASESLSYEIGETDYVSDQMDGAHVKTMWREPSAEGQMTSTEVIWVLRKQTSGWKISGMATPVVEGELPLLFNFEEPEDMLQKKAFVEQQLAPPADTAAAPHQVPRRRRPKRSPHRTRLARGSYRRQEAVLSEEGPPLYSLHSYTSHFALSHLSANGLIDPVPELVKLCGGHDQRSPAFSEKPGFWVPETQRGKRRTWTKP